MRRFPVIRFILSFDKLGGVNFGACGMDEGTAAMLDRLKVISVWYYRPLQTHSRRPGYHHFVTRHYRKVSAGEHMPQLAMLIRDELRQRNLAVIDGFDDGLGRVALKDDWRTRRADVQAAALAAWDRMVAGAKRSEFA